MVIPVHILQLVQPCILKEFFDYATTYALFIIFFMNFVVVLDESFHSGLCFCRMKRREIHSCCTWEAHLNTIRTSRQSTTVKKN